MGAARLVPLPEPPGDPTQRPWKHRTGSGVPQTPRRRIDRRGGPGPRGVGRQTLQAPARLSLPGPPGADAGLGPLRPLLPAILILQVFVLWNAPPTLAPDLTTAISTHHLLHSADYTHPSPSHRRISSGPQTLCPSHTRRHFGSGHQERAPRPLVRPSRTSSEPWSGARVSSAALATWCHQSGASKLGSAAWPAQYLRSLRVMMGPRWRSL